MRTRIFTAGTLLSLLVAGAVAQTGGKFYGVHWDGSQEHFVTLDPVSGNHTSLGVVPGVQWIDASFRIFDPDSSRFAFIGGTSGAMNYQVIDAATGTVTHTFPRNDNLKNPAYDPGTGKLYGTWWSDSSVQLYDSLGRPLPKRLEGTEFFSAIDVNTGARTDTPIPGLLLINASSHFLDTDSGRYVLHGRDTANRDAYYVIDVATGSVIAQVPLSIKLDFPVYNPVLQAVHGLWWSDSTVRGFDSLGRPKPIMPNQIKGMEYFVTVHGDSSIDLVELPDVKWIANLNRALDTDSGRYVFTGKAATGGIRYYVIDVATGAMLSNTLAPGRAVDHIVYAPMASVSYPLGGGTSVNPAAGAKAAAWNLRRGAGVAELAFANADGKPHDFALLDVSGKTILRQDDVRSNTVRIETAAMKAGVYFFRLRNAQGVAAAGKLIVE